MNFLTHNNNTMYWALVFCIMVVIRALHRKYAESQSYTWTYITALVVLPGTYLHELAHAVVGFIFNAKPVKLTVIPELDEDSPTGTLGMTWFANLVWYNAAPVGLAPLMLIPIALGVANITSWSNPVLKLAEAYLVANMLYSSIPSEIDMQFVKQYWWGPLVAFGSVALLVFGIAALTLKF